MVECGLVVICCLAAYTVLPYCFVEYVQLVLSFL